MRWYLGGIRVAGVADVGVALAALAALAALGGLTPAGTHVRCWWRVWDVFSIFPFVVLNFFCLP